MKETVQLSHAGYETFYSDLIKSGDRLNVYSQRMNPLAQLMDTVTFIISALKRACRFIHSSKNETACCVIKCLKLAGDGCGSS